MNVNRVAVHEVDGRRMHIVIDGLVDSADPPDHRPPPISRAYRRAVALFSVYRSRVDFLKQSA